MPQKGIDLKSKKLLRDMVGRLKPAIFYSFLESIMSSAEIKDISRRLMAAKLLKEKSTYEEIIEIMGMSESTVNKIHFKTKGSPTINKLLNKKN